MKIRTLLVIRELLLVFVWFFNEYFGSNFFASSSLNKKGISISERLTEEATTVVPWIFLERTVLVISVYSPPVSKSILVLPATALLLYTAIKILTNNIVKIGGRSVHDQKLE